MLYHIILLKDKDREISVDSSLPVCLSLSLSLSLWKSNSYVDLYLRLQTLCSYTFLYNQYFIM